MAAVQEADLIADLPLFLGQSSKILTADVYGITGVRKKRRPEVAVAINGGCVNIYDIKSAMLVTGYAVPAQSTFVCAPLSVRVKEDISHPARRLTYCVTQSSTLNIHLFTEKPGANNSPHPDTATKSRDLSGTQSPIKYLDFLPHSSDLQETYVLFCVHENGQIRLFSEDLDQEYCKLDASTFGVQNNHTESMRIICAGVMTTETAQETLLLGRGDIAARLQTPSESSVTRLLICLSKGPQEVEDEGRTEESVLKLHLLNLKYELSPVRDSRSGHSNVFCEEILISNLAKPSGLGNQNERFSFIERNGTLYYHNSRSYTCYKFNGHDMRIHRHVDLDIPAESCLQLGSTNIASSSKSTVSVVNTAHNSLLSRQEYYCKGLKQNQKQSEEGGPTFSLCSHFPTLQIMVAIYGRKLVTIPIGDSQPGEKSGRKRRRSGTLIDSVGRGWGLQGLTTGQPVNSSAGTLASGGNCSKGWEHTQAELQRLSEAGQPKKFDQVVSDMFQLKKERLPQELDETRRANFHIIQWILSQIFYLDAQVDELGLDNSVGPPALRIGFLPRKTFKWLIACSAVSSQQVELALKANKKMAISTNLPRDALIDAFSSSFVNPARQLNRLVADRCLLNPDEIAQALRYGLDHVEVGVAKDHQKRPSSRDDSSDIVEIDAAEYSNALKEKAKVPDQELVHSLIKNCLRHLHPLDTRIILRSLKANLRSSHLITLIDCLRLDLARGGWLSQFSTENTSSASPSEEHLECLIETASPDENISIITKLLNCTLDALGTTAWITASAATEANGHDRSNMLTFMKAEISAALEGIEEAAYLDGVLNQVLLYSSRAKTAMKGNKGTKMRLDKNGNPRRKDLAERGFDPAAEKMWQQKGGAVITQDDGTMRDVALPLDLQLPGEKKVGNTKVGNGGVVEKMSVREKEYLRSRQVGEYQFERIIW